MACIDADVWSLRITLPYAYAGIVVEQDRVTSAPPIFRWMLGQPVDKVIWWVRGKQGRIEKVNP